MAKTLIQIVQQVAGELQLSVPSNVISSLDSNVTQIKYLVMAACDELADGYNWQQLLSTHTFSTSDGVAEYDLPTDYLRMASNANWDRTASNPLIGCVGVERWEADRSGISSSGPSYKFRIVGGEIQLSPTPGATSSTLAFNYYSKNYVIDAGGTRKPEFTADDDRTVFHDRLLINFAKLKVLEVKGFNTVAAANNFNITLAMAMGHDVPAASVNAGGYSYGLISDCNIPDGNY